MTYHEEKENVTRIARSFPKQFGLRAFPGSTFTVSERKSYYSPDAGTQLVVQILKDGRYHDFSRCHCDELTHEIRPLS
jgi:hypothetical protein